jgi:uncharacterized protein (TIGR04141 family)
LTVPLHLNQLPELLNTLYDRFKETSYKKKFPWVDQIGEVADSGLQQELDSVLVSRVHAGKTENIWMAVPQLISWEKVSGFRFPAKGRSARYPDIHLQHFLSAIGGCSAISIPVLHGRSVRCEDQDGRKLHEWIAYHCLYAELEHAKELFVLSSGKWYNVQSDFVGETNAAYERVAKCDVTLPEFKDGSEGQYLRRVAESDPKRLLLLDQELIPYGGGHSQVEFCDLLSTDYDLFHVKRYGQASALSHLFAQGLISGELFQMDPRFREEINKMLPRDRRLQNVKLRPAQGQYRVVFAIISDHRGELRLPFFSRLNLKHAARRLEAYGFRVAKAKIDVNEVFSKTAKFRSRKRT